MQCWGRLAENARRCLRKGMSVLVVGTVILETWTDAETDTNRSRIVLKASHIGPDLNRYLTTATAPDGEIIAQPLNGGWVTSGCVPSRCPASAESGAADRGGVPEQSPQDDSHPRSGAQLVGAVTGADAEADPPF